MRPFRKISLSSAPFLASLVVITSLAVFIGIFWAVNEYRAYQESIDNIKDTYRKQYRVRVHEELEKVVELINYRRKQSDLRVERDIRERVLAAYTIASQNYHLYKDEKSDEEIRSVIVELLRPIRWYNGRGYYFTGRVGDELIDLFADEPFFEGKTRADFISITGVDVIGDISSIVREKEAGLYRYDLIKPKFLNRSFPKTTFVKYFQPLDWFIGAGIYSDDLETSLQREVLGRIQNIQFGKDGEVFCFRLDGTILSNPDERLIGRSVFDLVDVDGVSFGRKFLDAAQGGKNEGYVNYSVLRPTDRKEHQKLGFVQLYSDWGWVLGAATFMDAMEKTIAGETKTYQTISFKNVFSFIVLFAIAIIFLLLSTFFYSMKIKQGISMFTQFFSDAANTNEKIRDENMVFREFDDLRALANRMVDDRIKYELILHRNERRLDTLLRLGMMEKYSLQDKYDFVLRRMVEITSSQEGYLALVNTGQSYLNVCSFFAGSREQVVARQGELAEPCRVGLAGFPGRAVMKKTAILDNDCKLENSTGSYPYTGEVVRHLDVPVFSDGRIVIVAGVCNNTEDYGNADIRQIAMLLEGMWLHVLNKCAEEELARLERQIIAVSEEERSKIGRDLHDDLGSHLAGVELLSKVLQQQLAAEQPKRAAQLEKIRNLIKDAIEKTRRLSQGLYPVHLVEYGLESAMEELVAEVEKMFKVEIDFSWEGSEADLHKNTATHLHYIIREAVFNAARHGKPGRIKLYVRMNGPGFSVRIVDDGIGFDRTPAATGMGFHTMQYRAKAIKANLQISSSLNGGTVISIAGEGES
jgi:signal transduction histidine kinase